MKTAYLATAAVLAIIAMLQMPITHELRDAHLRAAAAEAAAMMSLGMLRGAADACDIDDVQDRQRCLRMRDRGASPTIKDGGWGRG